MFPPAHTQRAEAGNHLGPPRSWDRKEQWLGGTQGMRLSRTGPIISQTHHSPSARFPHLRQEKRVRAQRERGGGKGSAQEAGKTLHPRPVALGSSGKSGQLGSRGAPTSWGCGRHPEELTENEPLTRTTEGLLALHSPHGGTGSLLSSARRAGGQRVPGKETAEGKGRLGREKRPYSKESRSGCGPSLSRLEVRA